MPYTLLYTHFVFRTKRSARSVAPEGEAQLYAYVRTLSEKMDCRVIAINGMSDHIHMAVAMSPVIAPADYMREVKSRSSKWMVEHRHLFPYFEGWAHSYFAASISKDVMEKVCNYISKQKERHHHVSFRDELAELFQMANLGSSFEYFIKD